MLCKLRGAYGWVAYLLTDPLSWTFQLYCRSNLPLSSIDQPLSMLDMCLWMPGNKEKFISIMGHIGSQILGKMQSMAIELQTSPLWGGGASTTWILLIVNRPFKWYSPGLFNFGTIEVLGWIILCCGCCSVHCRMLHSIPGLSTIETSVASPVWQPKMSLAIGKYTLRGKIAWVQTTLFIYLMGHLGPKEGRVPPEDPRSIE